MSIGSMLEKMAPKASPEPGPLLMVRDALEVLNDIDFGTPEYAEATQAALDVANTQRARVAPESPDSEVLAEVIIGLTRFLSVDWTQPGVEVSEGGEEALLAAGGPEQARAPRGTPIGGQWINTPSGLVHSITGESPRKALALRRESPQTILHNKPFGKALMALDPQERATIAAHTRLTLRQAVSNGVTISMREGALNSIVATGRMETVMERGEDARGKGYHGVRNVYERTIMGIDPMRPANHLPIYGWGSRVSPSATAGYGPVEVHLKPAVKERTTWTVGDSMDTGGIRPIWTNEIFTADEATMLASSSWASHGQTDILREAASGMGPGESTYTWYVEAQVHGGVTLDDIATVVLPHPGSVKPGTMEALKVAGISVKYRFSEDPTQVFPGEVYRLPLNGEEPTYLAASGFSYSPNQARAPRGTPIGGQWIETPSGVLKLVDKLGPTGAGRSEEGTDVPGLDLTRPAPLEPFYRLAWSELTPEEHEEVASITRDALQTAVDHGVTISVMPNVLEEIARDGRFHTMRDRIAENDYHNGWTYIDAREKYEREVIGVPENLDDSQRPIYGWGDRMFPDYTMGYGNIDITLRESVNARTTWTVGDSLNLQSRPLWTDEISDPDLPTADLLAASHWAIQPDYGPMGMVKVREGWEFGIYDQTDVGYVEAQVYGGITLGDIETVFIPSRTDFFEDTLATLEAAGIEIVTEDGT